MKLRGGPGGETVLTKLAAGLKKAALFGVLGLVSKGIYAQNTTTPSALPNPAKPTSGQVIKDTVNVGAAPNEIKAPAKLETLTEGGLKNLQNKDINKSAGEAAKGFIKDDGKDHSGNDD